MAVNASEAPALASKSASSKTDATLTDASCDATVAAVSASVVEDAAGHSHVVHHRSGFWGLAIGSIGVVFGDIGTSPLYAFQAGSAAGLGARWR